MLSVWTFFLFVLTQGLVGTTAEVRFKAAIVCTEVAISAAMQGEEPCMAYAIASNESRCRKGLVSSAGARGPLQVIPKWSCPGGKAEGCDYIQAGLSALKYWKKQFKHPRKYLAHYNAGWTIGPRAHGYAAAVLRRQRRCQRAVLSYMPLWNK